MNEQNPAGSLLLLGIAIIGKTGLRRTGEEWAEKMMDFGKPPSARLPTVRETLPIPVSEQRQRWPLWVL